MISRFRAIDGETGGVRIGPGAVSALEAGAAGVETAPWDADPIAGFIGGRWRDKKDGASKFVGGCVGE
jgi:hypothetical protein